MKIRLAVPQQSKSRLNLNGANSVERPSQESSLWCELTTQPCPRQTKVMAGNHSVKAPLDIGLTSSAQAPHLPLYTLRNMSTQETVQTTDPGRAIITGKWADIGKFKGPILRGLAARAPYFHNGSAETLEDVVSFYERRFNIGFTASEKADLV
jgi:hypothetical protein